MEIDGDALPKPSAVGVAERSVPDIARARYVTRQHIQAIVDTLTDRELVGRYRNPGHRSSPLIAFTDAGAHAIDSMLDREHRVFDRRMVAISERDVLAATAVLVDLRAALDEVEAP